MAKRQKDKSEKYSNIFCQSIPRIQRLARFLKKKQRNFFSRLAQWERDGPITHRSSDRNTYLLLWFFFFIDPRANSGGIYNIIIDPIPNSELAPIV